MKKYTFLLTLILSSLAGFSQEYVCHPCGYECDSLTFEGPGSCSTCSMALVEGDYPKFQNIDFATACERISSNNDLVLIDVRSPAEFDGSREGRDTYGHLDGAINIPISEIADRLEELSPYKDKEIIVYCSRSHRSPSVAYTLVTSGFTNVTNIVGGVSILEKEFGDDTCLAELWQEHEGD